MITKEERAEINRKNGAKNLPKYKTASDLEDKINEYFDLHQTKENIPKWPGMLNYLNVSDDTLLRYRTDEKHIKDGYADVIKRAERRFSDTLIQLAADNPNLQSLCIFLLKQPHNGGYTDKQQIDSNNETHISVNIEGVTDKKKK